MTNEEREKAEREKKVKRDAWGLLYNEDTRDAVIVMEGLETLDLSRMGVTKEELPLLVALISNKFGGEWVLHKQIGPCRIYVKKGFADIEQTLAFFNSEIGTMANKS